MSTPTAPTQEKKKDKNAFDIKHALKRAMGGGVAGAAAMGIQVTALMWMRTIMNYQYRYGMSLPDATRALYKDGGIIRFYRGYVPALIQGPLSRFGDTAANAGALALLDSSDLTKELPVGVKTLFASFTAACFRIFLMPVDTVKTTMQVNGTRGIPQLRAKIATNGISTLWYGALAASTATFVGHYPWFFTYNYLQETLPRYTELHKKLARNAFIGFVSSAISDTVSNSIRVIKTYRQANDVAISYPAAVRAVVAQDGWVGLFGRGLSTRIIANGMQGLLFSVLWKAIEEEINKRNK